MAGREPRGSPCSNSWVVDLRGLPEIHSLWIGPQLTWIELLSLHSWLAHGHGVRLWCYDPIDGVPNAVCTADAATILPRTSIIRHRRTGSVALFSNRFRYHLLRREPATWLDLDMVLLRPLNHASPYLFGWEAPTLICSAVLRLPPGSPVLDDLIKLTGARAPVPRWWRLKARLNQRIKGLIGRHQHAEDMEWGTFGPAALTYFLLRRNFAGHASPIETFYPVHWTEIPLLFATPDMVSPRLTEKTNGVHLWSACINESLWPDAENWRNTPPANSWVGAMCKRYGVGANGSLGFGQVGSNLAPTTCLFQRS